MSSYEDPWEAPPEFPPAPLGEEDDAESSEPLEIAAKHRRLKWLAITAGGIAATVVAAPIVQESAQALAQGKTYSTPEQIKKGNDDARLLFVLKAVSRADRDIYGYCGRQEPLAARRYNRQDILEYNGMLRGELGLVPLKEDKLLDYAAQHEAQMLADGRALFSEFQVDPALKDRLRLEGQATGKWTKVEIEIARAGPGQAARAASCLIDSKGGAEAIKSAAYIGIGSAVSTTNHQRYLVAEYGINNT